jgi:microcystin-dependent protein
MADYFLGEIRLLPYGFSPLFWLPCQGQLLPISAPYTALFSILGTTYGGNGTTNFALPNLQDRAAVGAGSTSGLSTYTRGETTGTPNVSLVANQLPVHKHILQTGILPESPANSSNAPSSSVLLSRGANANTAQFTNLYATSSDGTLLATAAIGPPVGGSGQPHDNHQPYLGLQYCICISGFYPSRG